MAHERLEIMWVFATAARRTALRRTSGKGFGIPCKFVATYGSTLLLGLIRSIRWVVHAARVASAHNSATFLPLDHRRCSRHADRYVAGGAAAPERLGFDNQCSCRSSHYLQREGPDAGVNKMEPKSANVYSPNPNGAWRLSIASTGTYPELKRCYEGRLAQLHPAGTIREYEGQ